MVQENQYLARLASVARRDPSARDGLTNQLRPYLELLIRRVLRRGPHSPLEHRLSQIARRLCGDEDPANCSDELTGRICRGVITRLCGDAADVPLDDTQVESPAACELATAVA
jgi:hypothetical protein